MSETINPLNLQNIPNSISVSWPTPGDYNYAPVTRNAIQVIINNIQKNKNDINTIDGSIATLNTNVDSLSRSVTTLNTNVASISGSVTTLNTNVNSLSRSVNELSESLNSLNPGSCNIPINTINLNSNLIAYDFMQYTLEEQSGPLDGGFGWETSWIFDSSVVTQPLSNSFGGFQIGPNISGLGDVVLRGNGFNPIVRKLNTTLQDFWFLCAFNISLAGDWQWVLDFGFF
ncbi:MAG: hypothetical protein NZZ41_01590, partial [Candidatus Dojkabacteria bacterium]|nr:hypothetical protein [Candidatus Dojkabacteria bacterium]